MLRLFSSRCGHRASPAPRAVRSPTAQFIIVPVLRLFPSSLVLPSRASTEPTAQFIIVSVLRLFPSRLVLPSRASTSTEPTAQFSYPLVVTV